MTRTTLASLRAREMASTTLALRVVAFFLILIVASLSGCDDARDPVGPGEPGGQPAPVAQVSVNPHQVELEVGQEEQLEAQLTDAEGEILTGRPVTWTAGPSGVVSVDGQGVVRALMAGTAVVRATAEGTFGEAEIVVIEPGTQEPEPVAPVIESVAPTSIPAGSQATEVTVHGTGFDEATLPFWNGSSRPVTLVSATELRVLFSAEDLRLSGSGQLWVRRTSPQGAQESNRVPFVVTPAVASVEIVHATRIMFVGEHMPFHVRVLDDRGRVMDEVELEWSAADGSVVELDDDGWVRALGLGQTMVTVRAGGREASVVVRVSPTPSAGLITATWAPYSGDRSLTTFRFGSDPDWAVRMVEGNARQPAVSPDGTRIVFVTDTPDGSADLFLMAWDGSGLTRLTTNPGVDDQPAWSPDGQTIAFRSIRNGLGDVWTVKADGTGLRNVTDLGPIRFGLLGAERPAWSPDGQWIAFSWGDRGMSPARMSLSRVRPDGSDMRRITQPGQFEDTEPSFSPDGQQLVFRRTADGQDRITITDLDGTIQYFLYDLGTGRTPRWSPDGGWLVAVRNGGPNLEYGTLVLKELGREGERWFAGVFDATWVAPR